jgi:V/A-type H+-transporting ATPase subunit A
VGQMMKVVGEEGTSDPDFILYLKSEYLDSVYLQQDAFDAVDGATSGERQCHVFGVISEILKASMVFKDKDSARRFFHEITQATKDWNRVDMDEEEFTTIQAKLESMVSEVTHNA